MLLFPLPSRLQLVLLSLLIGGKSSSFVLCCSCRCLRSHWRCLTTDDVGCFKLIFAVFLPGDVFAATQLAGRLMFGARISGAAGEANVGTRVGADVALMSHLSARFANLKMLFVEYATHENRAIFYKVRHFRALKQHNHGC